MIVLWLGQARELHFGWQFSCAWLQTVDWVVGMYVYSGAQADGATAAWRKLFSWGVTDVPKLQPECTGSFQASVIPHPLIFSLAKPKVAGQDAYSTYHEAITRALMITLFECCEELRTVIWFSTVVIKSPHIHQLFLLWLLLVFSSSFPGNVCTPTGEPNFQKVRLSTQMEKGQLAFWKVLPNLPRVKIAL